MVAAVLWYNSDWYDVSGKTLQHVERANLAPLTLIPLQSYAVSSTKEQLFMEQPLHKIVGS